MSESQSSSWVGQAMKAWPVMALATGSIVAAKWAFDSGFFRKKSSNLRIVVTGGSRGLGKALVANLTQRGHKVVFCGRDSSRIMKTVNDVREVAGNDAAVWGASADISTADGADYVAAFALKEMGGIDVWVNNAGVSQGERLPAMSTPSGEIEHIIKTNVLGSLFGCRAAMSCMSKSSADAGSGSQGGNGSASTTPTPSGGSIVLIDGAGSRGGPTANSAAYGASKACIPQLAKSMAAEGKEHGVKVHVISPGMVLTTLLVRNSTSLSSKQIFNSLAARPEEVADWMANKIERLPSTPSGSYDRFLTGTSVGIRLLKSAFGFMPRLFDRNGEYVGGGQFAAELNSRQTNSAPNSPAFRREYK